MTHRFHRRPFAACAWQRLERLGSCAAKHQSLQNCDRIFREHEAIDVDDGLRSFLDVNDVCAVICDARIESDNDANVRALFLDVVLELDHFICRDVARDRCYTLLRFLLGRRPLAHHALSHPT